MTEKIGEQFMRETRHVNLGPSDRSRGIPAPPVQLEFDPSGAVALPPRAEIDAPPCDLTDVIERRRSVREYAPDPLTLPELSYLLWCTQGVRETGPAKTLRTVPSAGARHAFETFLLVNRVEGLSGGLYRFSAVEHSLIPLDAPPDIAQQIARACCNQQFVAESAATFIWSAIAHRMTWTYGQRGYRYLHLDAGHVCQNLYLAAGAVSCGACGIAAFEDEPLNSVLGLDGVEQFVVYLAAVGKLR